VYHEDRAVCVDQFLGYHARAPALVTDERLDIPIGHTLDTVAVVVANILIERLSVLVAVSLGVHPNALLVFIALTDQCVFGPDHIQRLFTIGFRVNASGLLVFVVVFLDCSIVLIWSFVSHFFIRFNCAFYLCIKLAHIV